MLKYMRTHATSWIIKVGLSFIIVVFALYFGFGRVRSKREGMVAEVNGQLISVQDFNEAYQNLTTLYRARFQGRLPQEVVRTLGLKQQALDGLINDILVYQEAHRVNLRVNSEELRRGIQSVPFFQVDGTFNRERYLRVLRLNRIDPGDFEEMQKQRLLIDKLRNLILGNTDIVSGREAQEMYLMENEKVNLDFVRIQAKAFLEEAGVTPAEVDEYFSHHRENFRIPERANLHYMVFEPKDYRDKIEVSEDEIGAYYEENRDDFVLEEQVKARHILVKVAPDAKAENVEEARKRAEEVLARAQKGEDFAALAEEYSEGPKAKEGGDLGYFARGNMVKEFEDAAFSLKPGEISSLVRTQFGFHIIKVEDIKKKRVQDLDEVRKSIESTMKDQRARETAERRAEEAFYTLYKGGEMEEVADEYLRSVKETGFFSRGEDIPGMSSSEEITSVAFSLKEGETSLVKVADNLYILRLTGKEQSRFPGLEEVREKVEKELKEKKAREKAESVAEKLLTALKGGKPIEEAVASNGLKVEETGFFSRWANYLPKVGFAEGLMEIISHMSAKRPYPDQPLKVGEDWVIVRFKELEKPDLKQFESEKENWEKTLGRRKAEMCFQRWLASVRAGAKIEILRDVGEL